MYLNPASWLDDGNFTSTSFSHFPPVSLLHSYSTRLSPLENFSLCVIVLFLNCSANEIDEKCASVREVRSEMMMIMMEAQCSTM